jgi:hypothetical protein
VDYCAAHVDAIMRTDATWMCWALDEAELPDGDALLGVLLEVVPAAPAVVVEPAPLVVEVELAGASVPVISTWWPLCCERSESRPSRTYVEPAIGMLLELPLPAVPAVVDGAPLVAPVLVLGVLEVDPALGLAAPPDAAGAPARALVSMN